MRDECSNRGIWSAVVIVWLVCSTSNLRAQTLPLPKIDNINFFGQAGSLAGARDLSDDPSTSARSFGAIGWGFETSFDALETKDWDIELAVGYDQMFLRTKFIDKYSLRGTLRNLPSISAYADHSSGFYLGLGTGLVSLSNVYASGDGKRFSVSGDTFDLAAHLGFAIGLGEKLDAKNHRTSVFVEVAYHARFLGGANYGMDAPASLPRSLYFGGLVFSVGAQFSLKSSKHVSDEDIKKELTRAASVETQPTITSLTTSTVCSSSTLTGKVVINDYWDPNSRCPTIDVGKPNVWVVADLPDEVSPGATMEVCESAPDIKGWSVRSHRWDSTRCGRPEEVKNNIKLIMKEP